MSDSLLRYPRASELDSLGLVSGGRVVVSLVPSLETDDGLPRIEADRIIGSGTTSAIYHNRAIALASYGANIDGDAIRAALVSREADLLRIDALYEGTRWDGHNQIGRWSRGARELSDAFADIAEGAAYEDDDES